MVTFMRTVADAKMVMAQNFTQLDKCQRFKATFEGHIYTFRHEGKVAGTSIAGEQTVTHKLTARTGSHSEVILWMMESRLGGELLFLDMNPRDNTGEDQVFYVALSAQAKFLDAVAKARAMHPRAT